MAPNLEVLREGGERSFLKLLTQYAINGCHGRLSRRRFHPEGVPDLDLAVFNGGVVDDDIRLKHTRHIRLQCGRAYIFGDGMQDRRYARIGINQCAVWAAHALNGFVLVKLVFKTLRGRAVDDVEVPIVGNVVHRFNRVHIQRT